MKRVLFLLCVGLFLGCSSSTFLINNTNRNPSSIANINNAQNPFEILNVEPNATSLEIERATISEFEKLTGWNIFDLTKYTEEEKLLQEITTLTESNQQSVKKVMDSYFLLKRLKQQTGFKIKLGKFSFNLGKSDLKIKNIQQLRDIKILFEDRSGTYEVLWVDDLKMGSAYQVVFHAKAKDEASQIKINELKARRKLLPANISSIREKIRIENEIKSLLAPEATNQFKNYQTMTKLQNELRLRYSLNSTPSTELLQRITQFRNKSCVDIVEILN